MIIKKPFNQLATFLSLIGRNKVGGLRNLIFNRYSNGFDKVIKKVGKRVLIDEAAFFDWVNEQNQRTR